MSTETSSQQPMTQEDEKKLLLARAKLMGLSVSNNSSVETLRAKVKEALEKNEKIERPSADDEMAELQQTQEDGEEPPQMRGQEGERENEDDPPEVAAAGRQQPKPVKESENDKRKRITKAAKRLVRIRAVCLNPQKKDLPGEIFTIGNRYIGTVKRYVPFDVPWHVEQCIYDHMKERQFVNLRTNSRARKGVEQSTVEYGDVTEFAIEVLPPLTAIELRKLALKQAAAAGSVTE